MARSDKWTLCYHSEFRKKLFYAAQSEVDAVVGEDFEVTLSLDNDNPFATIEYSIENPAGIEVVYDEEEEDYLVDVLGGRLSNNYMRKYGYPASKGGNVFLTVYVNMELKKLIKNGTGEFVTLTYHVDNTVAPGTYQLKVYDGKFGWIDDDRNTQVYRSEPFYIDVKVGKSGVDGVTVDGDAAADSPYYNLQGVEIPAGNLIPGIYIHNGKKIVIR